MKARILRPLRFLKFSAMCGSSQTPRWPTAIVTPSGPPVAWRLSWSTTSIGNTSDRAGEKRFAPGRLSPFWRWSSEHRAYLAKPVGAARPGNGQCRSRLPERGGPSTGNSATTSSRCTADRQSATARKPSTPGRSPWNGDRRHPLASRTCSDFGLSTATLALDSPRRLRPRSPGMGSAITPQGDMPKHRVPHSHHGGTHHVVTKHHLSPTSSFV